MSVSPQMISSRCWMHQTRPLNMATLRLISFGIRLLDQCASKGENCSEERQATRCPLPRPAGEGIRMSADSAAEQLWQVPREGISLPDNEAHVWRAKLARPPSE